MPTHSGLTENRSPGTTILRQGSSAVLVNTTEHDTEVNVFRHAPFTDPSRQIRLLKARNQSRFVSLVVSEEVHATIIRVVNLVFKNLPKYSAISYTWGDNIRTEAILLDGKRMLVSENCAYALSSVKEQCPDHVSIDQLCIDQSNLQEKAAQVSIMGTIFSNATTVYAVIGPHGQGTQLLFYLFNKFALHTTSLWEARSLSSNPWQLGSSSLTAVEQQRREWSRQFNADNWGRMVAALARLSWRPYFSRLWAIQKILVAAQPVLVCGNGSLDFKKLPFFLDAVRENNNERSRTGNSGSDTIASISPHLDAFTQAMRMTIHKGIGTLVADFSESKCHDLHDKVYGLLELAT